MPYNIGDKLNNKYWSGENYGWQSKATHEKLKEEGKFRLGTQAIDRVVSSGMNWATQNLPGVVSAVNTGLKTVGGVVNFTAEQLNKSATGRAVVSTVGTALETYDQALEAVSEATNIDKRVVGLTTDLAVGAVTGGSGTAAKLSTQAATGVAKTVKRGISLVDDVLPPPTGLAPAMAGGAPMPTPRPQLSFDGGGIVFKATTSPEWTGPGMGQGVAATPKYSKTVKSYMDRLPEYGDAEVEIERRFAAGEISAKRRASSLGKLKKKVDDLIATFAYDPENPPVYVESSPTKAKRATQVPDPIAEIVTGVPEKAHQHHYLAKAQTRPFIDKLLNLVNNNTADLDDLVNFFTWPEKYSLYPGGVRKNMADLSPRGHISSKSVTEFDRKYNTHKILQDVGLEVKSGTAGGAEGFIKKQYNIDAVTNADELMQVWDQFLQEIGVPSKEVAKNLQAFFLTEYRKNLSGDKLKQFNEMAAKLYK